MTTEIDLRETDGPLRDHLFDALDDADEGATRTIRAPDDVEHLLYRYQILREHALDWNEQDDPHGWELTKAGELDEETLVEFDVRDLPPQRRHTVLLETFDSLDAGQGFVLVNDHDPKPLSYELRSTRGDSFEWEYRSRESGAWKVEIRKTGTTETDSGAVLTTFDVREIPKPDRHPAIHHRYGMIPDGETIAIVAPHEPKPLRREFQQRYGDAFSWEVVDHEPGRCRVHVTKDGSASGAESTAAPAGAETGGCHHHDGDHSSDATEQSAHDETDDSDGGAADLTVTQELDVRDLPPAQRHEQIFDAYADLQDGTGFVLVNDHDPKPLYHQFDAEEGPEFYWEYRQRDPGEFRVLIGKSGARAESSSTTGQPESPF